LCWRVMDTKSRRKQGCQMLCFQTKTPNLGKFLEGHRMEILEYLMVIWNILRSFGIFYSNLEYFTVIWYILKQFGNVVVIWYIFPRFGIFCQEKSGNPGRKGKNVDLIGRWNLPLPCFSSMYLRQCDLSCSGKRSK
jgi:hypothetical protein